VPKTDDSSTWGIREIIESLKSGQESFRNCLEWLSEGAELYVNGHIPWSLMNAALSRTHKNWKKRENVKFLQLHGLNHTHLELVPSPYAPLRMGSRTLMAQGLGLAQRGWKDPLDPLCWHLIGLAQRSLLRVRRCRYFICGKFFEPLTSRRTYCSDNCRAKNHKKSPEEQRLYMRQYRITRRLLKLKSWREGVISEAH
jgi:hypothetical protein